MTKIYLSANDLLDDSYTLAKHVLNSHFTPNFVIGVWRGGAPVAAAVHEYMAYNGLETDHIAIRASSYTGIDEQERLVRLYGLEYVFEKLQADSQVLLVDDVFDSGKSMAAITSALRESCPALPADAIKIATPWFKPSRNKTSITPDFYLHQTDQWLVFPHELCGLPAEDIIANKTFLPSIKDLF